jgi:sulfoxide reductase heme-binding subunit YedZ
MTRPRRARPAAWLRPAVVTGGLVPAAALVVRARTGGLGANPITEALNELGLLALIFLVATLSCTPLRRLAGWTWPVRIRRDLGLLAFGYAATHFAVYAALEQGLDAAAILRDVAERRFIFVGFAALVMMAPLALTSTGASVRRLGFERWQRLHRLVYPTALLAVVHFVWRVKKDLTEPLAYGAVIAVLLIVRVVLSARRRPSGRLELGAPRA